MAELAESIYIFTCSALFSFSFRLSISCRRFPTSIFASSSLPTSCESTFSTFGLSMFELFTGSTKPSGFSSSSKLEDTRFASLCRLSDKLCDSVFSVETRFDSDATMHWFVLINWRLTVGKLFSSTDLLE